MTDRELDIMNVLWECGSGTVAEVREALQTLLAHTTVLTVLRILVQKGHVRRIPEGRAHRYYAITPQRKAKRTALRRLTTQLFDSSPLLLITELVRDRRLSEEDLRELKVILDKQLRERPK